MFRTPLWFLIAVLSSALLWFGDPQNYFGDRRRSGIEQTLCLFDWKRRRKREPAMCPTMSLSTQLQQRSLCSVSLCPVVIIFSQWCQPRIAWPILGPDSACLEAGLFLIWVIHVFQNWIWLWIILIFPLTGTLKQENKDVLFSWSFSGPQIVKPLWQCVWRQYQLLLIYSSHLHAWETSGLDCTAELPGRTSWKYEDLC